MSAEPSTPLRPLSIVLAAEEAAGLHVLRALARTPHRVHAVLTGGRETAADVAALARRLGIRLWPAARVRDPELAAELAQARIDMLLNVHSLYLVHEAILEAPRLGAFNLHPGPLPRYAGLNCPSWAIYEGAHRYGVTVHRMAPRIDAGPIAYTESFDIEDTDTALGLATRCVRVGIPLLLRLVETAATDPAAIPAIAQDLTIRRYYGRAAPQNAAVAWSEPARRIAALVRACTYAPLPSPWGHAHARSAGARVELLEVVSTGVVCDSPPGTVCTAVPPALDVATGDDWLRVRRVRVGGRAGAPATLLSADRLDDGEAVALAAVPAGAGR